MKAPAFILMLASAYGFAQTPPAKKKTAPAAPSAQPAAKSAPIPAKWPIESIAVEGNRFFTPEQVVAVAGLKVGQQAGRADFEAARDRLVACGAFEAVSYRFVRATKGEGFAATFQVNEVEQIYPVEFEELHVSSKDLRETLRQKDPLFAAYRLPATQPALERYSRWVQEFLSSKGITEKIAANVESAGPGEYKIVFHPARIRPSVAQVTFEGNHLIPQKELREAIAGAGIGAAYSEDSFRLVLNASIRPLYERRGRLRVSFPQVRTEPTEDVKGLHVFVTVDEGPAFDLGKVTIAGTSPVDPASLLKTGDFKTGEAANIDKVNEGLEAIRKAVRRAGYMDARVSSDRRIDEGKKTVDVEVQIDPGALYTMGKLALAGLDLHGEAEMKRIWGLAPGKPFNPDYPEVFLRHVKEGGFFDNLGQTKAETKVNSRDRTVDVTLTFGGAKPDQRPGRGARGPGAQN